MDEIYAVFKGFLDPLFIVFVLLIISFFIFLLNSKKKSDALPFLLCIVLIYGASIAPVSNYLCYYLEKDYINNPNTGKNNIDVIVVLGSGTKQINSLKDTFNSEIESLRLLHAVAVYNKSGAQYFVCSGKGDSKSSEAETMAKFSGEIRYTQRKNKNGT